MKKKLFAIGAAAFMVSAAVLTFSTTPVQAQGGEELPGAGWKTYDGTCAPENTKHIITCGVGTDASCTASGTCP